MAIGDPWCEVHGFTPCRCYELGLNKMSGNFTVLSTNLELRLRKLEAFYATIRDLANKTNLNKTTLIYEALSEVNPKWNESNTDWDNE